jgi:hypothetical protein
MGAEERASARRTLHEHGFPWVPGMLGGECLEGLRSMPEPPQVTSPTLNCNRSELALVLPDTPIPNICTDEELRGRGWPTTTSPTRRLEVGIVPPIEPYAWLELKKLIWREGGWEDRYSVPRKHQERLVKEFLSEQMARAEAREHKPRRTPQDVVVLASSPEFPGGRQGVRTDPGDPMPAFLSGPGPPDAHASLLKLPPPRLFFCAATPAPGLRPLVWVNAP